MTCTVTIIGLWSHSGTGEEWADDSNAMTAADAQAFKRPVIVLDLAAISVNYTAGGLIWTRTSNQNECPRSRPGDSRELAEWDPSSGNQRKWRPAAGKWLQWKRAQRAEVEPAEAGTGDQFGR